MQGIHSLLAAGMGKHWEITDAEAKAVSTGLKRALRHHDMRVQQKYVDYGFCAVVLCKVYGSRTIVTLTGKGDAPQTQATDPQGFTFPHVVQTAN